MAYRLLEGISEGRDGRETVFRPFRQSAQDDSIKGGRNPLIECSWGWWLDIEVQIHQVRWGPLKGWQADEQFVGYDCKRILIGCKHRATNPLFGSHIKRQAIHGGTPAQEGGCLCCNVGFS